MRSFIIFLLSVTIASLVHAEQKIDVFPLENREASSLVSVIGSVIGPEGRVSVDDRTNSLIVSYPAEKEADLRRIIAQLDQADPNIELELVTIEASSEVFNHLGLTGRTHFGANAYASLLPLLTENRDAKVERSQRITTRNNTPANLTLATGPAAPVYRDHHGYRAPQVQYLEVLPRLLADNNIEVKLAAGSPTLDRGHNSRSEVFTTVLVENGGAIAVAGHNSSSSSSSKAQVPIIPFGLESNKSGNTERVVLLHVRKQN
ncbi:MAG: secretin N-terminal domain-containing protein [Verrucomicrobiota bacterium]